MKKPKALKPLKRFRPPQGHTKALYKAIGEIQQALSLIGVEKCFCGKYRHRKEVFDLGEEDFVCVHCMVSSLQHIRVRRPDLLASFIGSNRYRFEKVNGPVFQSKLPACVKEAAKKFVSHA